MKINNYAMTKLALSIAVLCGSGCVATPGEDASSAAQSSTPAQASSTPTQASSTPASLPSSSANSSLASGFVPPPEEVPGEPELVMAINAGGGATTLNGIQYQADAYFTGGETYVVDVDIQGTNEDTVYVTERYNASKYAIPVENGTYNVVLNFSETYHQVAGERLFNVLAEGQTMLSNVDIFATAGFNTAWDETISNIVVNDGQLNIEFSVVAANPKITGIVVYKQDTVKTHAATGKEIFDAQCVSCHAADSEAIGTRDDKSGHDLNSLMVAAMGMPVAPACNDECAYYTAKYIASVNPFFERPIPGPEPVAPTADVDAVPPVISRLSKIEYNNTVRDLFGINSKPANAFPEDTPGQFTNDNSFLSASNLHVEKFAEAAAAIADEVVQAAASGNRSVISCDIANANCAQTVINGLGTKVWRRPLSNEEASDLLSLYNNVQSLTGNRTASMTALLRAMLLSPNFLYRPEFDQNLLSSTARPLSAYELATRMSYFLWSSTPDDQLLGKAANGSLLNDATLREEVARMLADPRAESLIDNFAMYWLGYAEFDKHQVNRDLFPQYTDEIKQALLTETRMFLSHIIKENRPLAEILDAEYTFLNQALANYYGIQGISGSHFRMYQWPEGSNRKGLLGHASALTAHAKPDATSPVKRGTWVMDKLMCDRPPEPDGNIIAQFPTLPEGLNPREVSERHKESSPVCAACHAYVDPIGYAMETFSPVGQYREYYPNGDMVNPASVLPTGEEFYSLVELADILAPKGQYTLCSIGYAMTFALGRRVDTLFTPGERANDYAAVYGVYKNTLDTAHSIQDVFTEIVLSPAFRSRRGADSQ